MRSETSYHAGELEVQERAGELEIGRRNSVVIGDTIPKGAWSFVEQQRMVVLGSLDSSGHVWVSLMTGTPGFMSTSDGGSLDFDLTKVARNPRDPFWENIDHDARVGSLVIDLGSRRRLRVNGEVGRAAANEMILDVAEAYPNCPKYIQRRYASAGPSRSSASVQEVREGAELTAEQRQAITAADTLFVASAHPDRGVDASHRGGQPGFVHVLDSKTLRIPDYVGNSMFNTLGNFSANPAAGLLFAEFDQGRTLQLTGQAKVLWDQPDKAGETGGTRRYWEFTVERWLETSHGLDLEWEFLDSSPFNPKPSGHSSM